MVERFFGVPGVETVRGAYRHQIDLAVIQDSIKIARKANLRIEGLIYGVLGDIFFAPGTPVR